MIVELSVCKKNNKKNSASLQRISNMNGMNYDHNNNSGLFQLQLGYKKFYLNSPKCYSLNINNVQTAKKMNQGYVCKIYSNSINIDKYLNTKILTK